MYKRPSSLPSLGSLEQGMLGVGMLWGAEPSVSSEVPNLEDVVWSLSVRAMEHDDLKGLDMLMVWLERHGWCLRVERLLGLAAASSARTRALWALVGAWQSKQRRLARLRRLYQGPALDLLEGQAFLVQRGGLDPRLPPEPLVVPAGVLRWREQDVVSVEELAQRHPTYAARLQMGVCWRADMWSALRRRPDLSAAQLARLTYGPFATAWEVRRDFARHPDGKRAGGLGRVA